ncbi:hypothetical protein PVAG01_05961 [Phlyctema vagabunda]|uniref:Major facilitator superfamily (MFS) profile domain-containing protein n=1 Tax=Phlyctema vagabunda TaxID=108571 RepID=A0ABR4PEW2_9HELO
MTRTSLPAEDQKKSSTDTAVPSVVASMEDHGEKGDVEKGTDDLTRVETEPEYPSFKKAAIIILACGLSMFLVALDRLIITTAIPRITDDFHSLNDVGWYASAYLLGACATQLIWGRIFTFYNSKFVYLAAIGMFELGSVICGAAPNSNAFIVGRAIAGTGSAGVFSGTIIVVTHILPLHKRPMVSGVFGSIFGISSVVGPLLGGAFTDNVSWRWCFYINLPIGAVTVAVLTFILHLPAVKNSKTLKEQLLSLDPYGTAVFLPGVICLLLALQWGGVTYDWSSARIIALFVLAGVLLVAFAAIQVWQKENATLPLRILKNRSIACGASFTILVAGSMITMIYFIPLWFQAIKGVSAVQSGINNLAMVLAMVVSVISTGVFVAKAGYYVPPMLLSPILLAVGAGLITTFSAETSSSRWIGYQIIYGLGLGMGMQQASMAAQTCLSRKDVSTGISLMFFCQSLGGAIFVCIAESLFTNTLAKDLRSLPGQMLDTQTISTAGATQLRQLVSPELLPEVLVLYNKALHKAFFVALGVGAAAIIPALGMEWKSVKKDKAKDTAAMKKDSKAATEEKQKAEGSDEGV